MLFRRVLEHVRAHNWIAVIIDFLIVVVGIFVGLQVDQWNQDRKDRVLEAQYMQSIKKDMQADVSALDQTIEETKDRALAGRFLISALNNGEVGKDPNEFVWAVYTSFLLNYPSYTRATVDELRNTGNLRIIRNEALKSELANYYSEIARHEQFEANWRDMQIALEHSFPEILDYSAREAGFFRYTGGPEWSDKEFHFSQEDAETILARLLNHPLAKGQIENMNRIQDRHYLFLVGIRARAQEVLGTL
jgi:hypothetical protein